MTTETISNYRESLRRMHLFELNPESSERGEKERESIGFPDKSGFNSEAGRGGWNLSMNKAGFADTLVLVGMEDRDLSHPQSLEAFASTVIDILVDRERRKARKAKGCGEPYG